MGVLIGDEIEEWAAAEKCDPLADGAALRLESDLRSAKGKNARQRPARDRQDAVDPAGAEKKRSEGDAVDAGGTERGSGSR